MLTQIEEYLSSVTLISRISSQNQRGADYSIKNYYLLIRCYAGVSLTCNSGVQNAHREKKELAERVFC